MLASFTCATSCWYLYQAKLLHMLSILSSGDIVVHYPSSPTWKHWPSPLLGYQYQISHPSLEICHISCNSAARHWNIDNSHENNDACHWNDAACHRNMRPTQSGCYIHVRHKSLYWGDEFLILQELSTHKGPFHLENPLTVLLYGKYVLCTKWNHSVLSKPQSHHPHPWRHPGCPLWPLDAHLQWTL